MPTRLGAQVKLIQTTQCNALPEGTWIQDQRRQLAGKRGERDPGEEQEHSYGASSIEELAIVPKRKRSYRSSHPTRSEFKAAFTNDNCAFIQLALLRRALVRDAVESSLDISDFIDEAEADEVGALEGPC